MVKHITKMYSDFPSSIWWLGHWSNGQSSWCHWFDGRCCCSSDLQSSGQRRNSSDWCWMFNNWSCCFNDRCWWFDGDNGLLTTGVGSLIVETLFWLSVQVVWLSSFSGLLENFYLSSQKPENILHIKNIYFF